PAPGDPPFEHREGHFYLVNLGPAEIFVPPADQRAGLLALSWNCTHLKCRVMWVPDKTYGVDVSDGRFVPRTFKGEFYCDCHDSQFTKSGFKFFGPASRALDTMKIEPLPDGD